MTVNKANKLLGLVYRAVGSSNPGAFSALYKSLVRPVLEYAAPVWNPYLVKDVFALERVQRRASRLKTRWLFLSSAECCKIVFDDFNKPNFDNLFEFTKCDSTRANYPYKLHAVKLAKCNPYKYSFFIRIVQDWNIPPGFIVEAGSLSRFKSALKRFLNIH